MFVMLGLLASQAGLLKLVLRRLGLIIPPRLGAIDKLELDLPGAANHELLSYRIIKDSPVMSGERIPRWAVPSLVIRDGKSMRYQYAGRLRENDQVYMFVAPTYSKLLDRLFASRAPVDEDDAEFFGAFSISATRPARELDAAYGPGLLHDNEKDLSIGDLIALRLGGHVEYADRVRLGSIILIVRDLDEQNAPKTVGISLEVVEPATSLPIFINLREIAHRVRDFLRKHRRRVAAAIQPASATRPATPENDR